MKKMLFLSILCSITAAQQIQAMHRMKSLMQLVVGAGSAGLSLWTAGVSGKLFYEATKEGLHRYQTLPPDLQTPIKFAQCMQRAHSDLAVYVALPILGAAFGPVLVAGKFIPKGIRGLRAARTKHVASKTPHETPPFTGC